jgi:hypothetical protein
MTILRKAKKGKFLNSLEKYHTFLASKQETHMNEFGVDHNNPIYETMYEQLKEYPHTQQHINLTRPQYNRQTHHTPWYPHRHSTRYTTQVRYTFLPF